MSQYYQSPRSQSGMYVPLPVDREALGEKKVEALQRQIAKLENDQQKRREMIERLSNIQNTQDRSKQEQQNRVLERYNKKNIPLPYDEEKYRNTGKIPASPREIEKILAQRTRDFSQKQHESAIETQYLVKERERLQAARDRIREQRRVMLSPAGKKKHRHELDVISFLKGLGLYHHFKTPPLTPLPWERNRYRNGKKIRYVACPLFRTW